MNRGPGASSARGNRGKGLAGAVSLLAIGAVLWPILENWREEPEDGFPLSYYPMFTAKRPERVRMNYMVGLDAEGVRHPLPYTFAGVGGLNQVRRQINRMVREGNAEGLCRIVAAGVAGGDEERLAGVVTVQVVTGEYRLADYFAGQRDPVCERVRASWPVERDRA